MDVAIVLAKYQHDNNSLQRMNDLPILLPFLQLSCQTMVADVKGLLAETANSHQALLRRTLTI